MPEVPTQTPPTYQGMNRKNILIGTIIGAVLVGLGILFFNLYLSNQTQVRTPQTGTPTATSTTPTTLPFTIEEEVTFSGKVIENNEEALPLDGPAYLVIEIDSEGTKTQIGVQYHPGEAECSNQKALESGLSVKAGDNVTVFGKAVSTNTVFTCDSIKYYIRLN